MSDPRIDLHIDVTNKTKEQTPSFEPRDWYPSSQAQELVRKFHDAVDEPIGHHPQSIGPIRGFLRSDLIKNGLDDFEKAVNDDDLVDQYDALLEIILQAYGTLVEMGVDAGPGKREVMRSKMTMVEEVFEEPNLFNVLTKQGWQPSYEDYLKYNDLKDPREVLHALPGKPDLQSEVIRLVAEENPEEETLVKVERGVRHDGQNYFRGEPHEYKRQLYQNVCVCGGIEAEVVHHVANPDAIDWDIDNNAPRRKDNFHDKVMSGWVPPIEVQILYEKYRHELEYKYPTAHVVDGELEYIVYRNGEKDIDWDFTINAPRVVEE